MKKETTASTAAPVSNGFAGPGKAELKEN